MESMRPEIFAHFPFILESAEISLEEYSETSPVAATALDARISSTF